MHTAGGHRASPMRRQLNYTSRRDARQRKIVRMQNKTLIFVGPASRQNNQYNYCLISQLYVCLLEGLEIGRY